MIKYLVSINVLNWNGELHIHKCMECVMNQTYTPIEIILIDNGSTDGSLEKIREKYPNIIYIENTKNIGFARAMNQGINASRGDFVVPLNQDVCLHKNFIEKCVTWILKDDNIGAIGGRVFSWVGENLTRELRKGEGEGFFLRKRFQGLGSLEAKGEKYVFGATGSFPFFRRKMLDDVYDMSGDYYDENYVTGWEDVDLWFRMQLRGWKCLFIPAAYGWHVGSGSVGGNATLLAKSFEYQVRVLRNRYFTIIKNIPINIIFWLSPYLLLTEVTLIPYFLLKSPKTIIALLLAWKQVVSKFSVLRFKRRKIMKSMIVPKNYLKQFFIKF